MLKETKFIGLGGCGSKLVNELYNISTSANIGFINSNANEMKILNNYSPSNSLFINGNGTGRNRQVAKDSLKESKDKIIDFIYDDMGKYSTYVLFASLDGGFGSGSFPLISKLLKTYNQKNGVNVTVNLVCVVPKNNSRKINMNNTLTAYADIMDLKKKGIINSYQFIDNNKMVKEQEFNSQVVSLISKAYSINNLELDINDAKIINSTTGYKMVLELDDSFSGKLGDAINYAFTKSPFLVPKNIGRCKNFGCSFIEENFNKNDVLDKFNITDFDKEDYNDEMNIVILGGMEDPSFYFKDLEEAYNKEDDAVEVEEFIPTTKAIKVNNSHVTVEAEVKLSKKDLRNMIDDLDLWD